MNNKIVSLSLFFSLICLFIACQKESDSNDAQLVTEIREAINLTPTQQLGRVLFYETSLSVSNTVSCGSCHKQENAFADNTRFSVGYNNIESSRNTPTIQNLDSGFERLIFWDGRASMLQDAAIEPIFNHSEMGMREPEFLITVLESLGYYDELFTNAYGNSEITLERIGDSLGKFLRKLQSDNFNIPEHLITQQVLDGANLFHTKYDCSSCHNISNSTGYNVSDEAFGGINTITQHTEFSREDLIKMASSNIGLEVEYEDKGVGALLDDESQNGKFKIPSLNNISLTAPYMHDGRYETLDEVLDHYSDGIKPSPQLDSRLKDWKGDPQVLAINEDEKEDIIAFLNVLKDEDFLTNPDFANPFVKVSE